MQLSAQPLRQRQAAGEEEAELYATLINVDMQKMIFQRTTQRKEEEEGYGDEEGECHAQIYFA